MSNLPEKFSALESLAGWAHRSEAKRVQQRRDASADELRSFYDTMKPQLEQVLDHLDTFTMEDMPNAEQNLFYLTLMMAEVAFAVEKYDADGVVPLAISPEQFAPIHDQ